MGEHSSRSAARRPWSAVCAVAASAVVASGVVVVVFQARLSDAGRGDLALSWVVAAVYLVAVVSAGVVGAVLVVRRDGHPVGSAFLLLAVALAVTLAADVAARFGAVADPGSVPGAAAVASLLDPSFVVFFSCVTLALHLTPTGRPLTPRWGLAARASVVAAGVAYLGGVVSDRPIDPPFERVDNPFAVPALGGAPAAVMQLGAAGAAVGLAVGAASLVVRYRRASGLDQSRLLWMALAAIPVPVALGATFVFRDANNGVPLTLATGGWAVVVPVAAGLSIGRYHLYDVDRIVSRTFTYLLLSGVVVVTYAGVVVATGEALSGRADSSTVAAVVATLAAVSVAAPARRVIQDGLDRRFNRRRFDALRVVERHLRAPEPGATVESVLRRALGDPTLRVTYPVGGQDRWVTGDGKAVTPGDGAIELRRAGAPVARLDITATDADLATAEAAAALALPELDNARLRAAVALQLVEVEESRARIAAAQLAERRRIERNLHDGAQQRLLAIGFELKAAQLNGDPDRLGAAVAFGVDQAHAALGELRDLANGLHPAVLHDGGIAAALDDLARRAPALRTARCPEARYLPEVEAAAWFVVCEAVANAHKHAAGSVVTVEVDEATGWLDVVVRDDGPGGADPAGRGLEGIRDRVEAAGGSLSVESPPGAGTTVRSRLPCGR